MLRKKKIYIAPSIIAADFSCLEREIKAAEEGGADMLHLDVMDGHFVPNITFGTLVVEAVRKISRLPVDVHLMIEGPERYIESFVKSGADRLTIHREVESFQVAIENIRQFGIPAGLAIRPDTPVDIIKPSLGVIDFILVMSVYPGFGGQVFIPESLERVRRIKELVEAMRLETKIAIDGGINGKVAPEVVGAGVDILISGSFVFKNGSVSRNIGILRESVGSD